LWLLQVPKITVRKLNYIQIDVYMTISVIYIYAIVIWSHGTVVYH